IQWSVNGTAQPDLAYTGNLAPGEGDTVVLGNYTFGGGDVLKVWTSMPNGVADLVTTNDTITTTLCSGLAGNYTINSALATGGTNFDSFGALSRALQGCGLAGPVVVSVTPGSGPYTEQVKFFKARGASATNTITIKGNLETLQFTPVSS